ncbi:MAG: HAMP domain-containing histidine kinase [Sphingobacteriales bacterium]|nr:MAG: HAMP domain-containing histidine kinase [Sphingobacteriales bacterium]
MFKRYPYKGWLLISILLWCVAGYRYYAKNNEVTPVKMARSVERNLQDEQQEFQQAVLESKLVDKIFANQLSPQEVEDLTDLSFYIYAYRDDGLIFWNSNEMLADCSEGHYTSGVLLNTDKGSFLKQCVSIAPNKKITILYPIVIKYPFENNYLKSHFEAEDYIPVNTTVGIKKEAGSIAVKDISNKVVFYLNFSKTNLPVWIPGRILIWILGLALLSTIFWVQLITIHVTRKRSITIGFLLTIIAVIGIRALTYVYGLPFNLGNMPIFSPLLYASSSFLPSLGDLLINSLCFLWIVVFAVRNVQSEYFEKLKIATWLKIVVAILIAVAMVWHTLSFSDVIRSIVLDSRISFDVSHFYSITFYTLVGITTIAIVVLSSCLFIYILNILLSGILGNRLLKYAMLVVVGLTIIFVTTHTLTATLPLVMLGWLLLVTIFLDIKMLVKVTDLFSWQTVFWAVFVCICCTIYLQHFVEVKEVDTRKNFAEQIVKQRDYLTEFTFKNTSASIQNDAVIKNFLQSPTPERRRTINERFDALYLGGQLNKYQSKVLLYNAKGQALYNNDTAKLAGFEFEKLSAEPTADSTLYYRGYTEDGHYYLAAIPVFQDSSAEKLQGYAVIDLAIKEGETETVYPELLQPGSIKNMNDEAGYSYAVYVNNKLITQTADYSFPVHLNYSIPQPHTIYDWENSSELLHKVDDTKTVFVIRYNKMWLESITLFSYLFGILMLIVFAVVLYRVSISYFSKPKHSGRFINLTLRNRIQFSMLAIVLISFMIIGAVTILYFSYQYRQSSTKSLQRTMQIVQRTIQQYLNDHDGLSNEKEFNYQTNTAGFKYMIAGLANTQKVDINVYKNSGILSVTSQENIYDKFLLARIIKPDAYYQLDSFNKSLVTQNEKIGRLSYLSGYVPVYDGEGKTLGYINVPYFSSQKELNYQISNIVVALINLFAIIFLVSSLLTVFITRWLTRTLSVVISRFEKLSLSKNERIEWQHDDEIGALVKEYNKMVNKVEESAILLAQNERETAWREMAKQVAHEIKNPLTPMKLNIQYLQQALSSGYANVNELAAKVSESLIEQIDNLSYIASEFSNFAKLPEAKPEVIELNEVLSKAVELYLNEENVKVIFNDHPTKLKVYADKSQLVRVLANILGNAVQAIPDERTGMVTVSLQKQEYSALIIFSDNGNGIDEEIVEKIFQPYFTTKTSGTGLGLAMTKKIIEFWKGKIWFETQKDKGTTFYIQLPLEQE